MPYRAEARAEVVATLIVAGGRIKDRQGFAMRALAQRYQQLFHDRDAAGLSALVRTMARQRQTVTVSRQVRRTHEIALGTVDDELVEEAIDLLARRTDTEQLGELVAAAGFAHLREHAVTAEIAVQTTRQARHTLRKLDQVSAERDRRAAEVEQLRQERVTVDRKLADAQRTIAELTEQLTVAREDLATYEQDLADIYRTLEEAGIELERLQDPPERGTAPTSGCDGEPQTA